MRKKNLLHEIESDVSSRMVSSILLLSLNRHWKNSNVSEGHYLFNALLGLPWMVVLMTLDLVP